MKKAFISIGLIVSVVLLIYFSRDTYTRTYINKEEALRDNSVQRGWVPSILPDSAYEIVETHNIDTNKINGSFQYLEEDEEILLINIKNQEGMPSSVGFMFKVDKEKNKVEFSNSSNLH